LGAERCVNYREADFVDVVNRATGGRGVDVILDMVGGPYFPRNIATLAMEGRLVEIATLGGATAEINIQTVMQRRLTITGSTLRARPVAEKAAIASALRANVWPLLESGEVTPIVFRTFPLRDAAAAHALMESSQHIGKIVLVTRSA
jgi:NADPH2:quinone reductase